MSTSIGHTARGLLGLGIAAGLAAFAAGCIGTTEATGDEETTSHDDDALTSAQKRAVSDHIKSVSAGHGVTNPLLFAGIPNHESGLVQCWRDATWACQGPYSSYCGGPTIAGSGDGPCENQQGGIGMYQLDAGTYAQTLATYGDDVVELDGNIDKGVALIIQKVWHCPNTPHFDNEAEVVAWINSAKPGTANYETFLSAMAYCYNGCNPGWSCFEPMRQNYRNGVSQLEDAFGDGYWYGSESPGTPTPKPEAPSGCGTMTGGQGLTPGQSYASCDGRYSLVMQTDGNLVLYHDGQGALWATGTDGKGGHTAIMQTDGNFVLYDANSHALWSSKTNGHNGAYLAPQDDGNLVVYAPGGDPIWASNTNGK